MCVCVCVCVCVWCVVCVCGVWCVYARAVECGPILRAVQKVIGAKGSVQSAKMFHYVPITVAASACGSLRLGSGDEEKMVVGWGRRCGARRQYSSSLLSHGSSVSEQDT